jgi:hypothetical protein
MFTLLEQGDFSQCCNGKLKDKGLPKYGRSEMHGEQFKTLSTWKLSYSFGLCLVFDLLQCDKFTWIAPESGLVDLTRELIRCKSMKKVVVRGKRTRFYP